MLTEKWEQMLFACYLALQSAVGIIAQRL
jgi:hypothetical protein